MTILGSMSDSVLMVDLTCRTPPYDHRLCEGLQSKEVPVELWAAGCHSDELQSAGFCIRRGWSDVAVDVPIANTRISKGLKALEYVINVLALVVRIRRNPPAVVHFQWLPLLDVGPWEVYLLRLLRYYNIPVVYTVHDVLPLDNPDDRSTFQRYRRIYREVTALICHTATSKERLQREFGITEEKIWHIPHGPLHLEEEEKSDVPLASIVDTRESERFVLLFGVLRPYKGYEFLLRTWKSVTERLKDVRLVIAGRASSAVEDEIDQLVKSEGISSSVSTIYRYLSDGELSALINEASVLAYPYQNITQSGALFTGMASGTAIVATSVGGIAETIQDKKTGQLVPYGDEEALSNALVGVLTDEKKRRRLGQAALRDLQMRFSWEEIARQTVACYESVASKPSSSTSRR